MRHVRAYVNHQEGTTWWAEDDSGFVGGADRPSVLIKRIHEWAGCEWVLDDLAVQLVRDRPEAPPVNPFSVTGLSSTLVGRHPRRNQRGTLVDPGVSQVPCRSRLLPSSNTVGSVLDRHGHARLMAVAHDTIGN